MVLAPLLLPPALLETAGLPAACLPAAQAGAPDRAAAGRQARKARDNPTGDASGAAFNAARGTAFDPTFDPAANPACDTTADPGRLQIGNPARGRAAADHGAADAAGRQVLTGRRMPIQLDEPIGRILEETETATAAVAFHDYATGTCWSTGGDRFYHAASTIKVAILVGLFALIEEGIFEYDSPIPVRNGFRSAVDGSPFSVEASRDGCQALYSALGETRPLSELARHMIVTSSNLATNLLIEAAGVEALQAKLRTLGARGIELERGVEDEVAFERGVNNRVTANGLRHLFGLLLEPGVLNPELAGKALQILFDQEFNQRIPAGLPSGLREKSRIAHKTGEISTVAHDAGLVYLPGRKPYALVILTERVPGKSRSDEAISRLSRLMYERFVETAA